jgi:hypothetical protein
MLAAIAGRLANIAGWIDEALKRILPAALAIHKSLSWGCVTGRHRRS